MRALAFALLLCCSTARSEIGLVAKALVPGTASDRSGLRGTLENGVPANRLGGFGSAIAYTGKDDVFIALSDRGPNAAAYDPAVDNTASYAARFHTFRFRLRKAPAGSALPYSLAAQLQSTTLLYSTTPLAYGARPLGRDPKFLFTGRSDAFAAGHPSTWLGNGRLDPEGVRLSNDGRALFLVDEYGPSVYRFDRAGKRTGAYPLPAYYGAARPGAAGRAETTANTKGRVANRSLEGLAITPDGRWLVGMMQSPLIQDGGVGALPVRLIAMDTASSARREYVYPLAVRDNMVSEILAVSESEFLVLERDGLEGDKAAFKRIYRIGLDGARNVAGIDALPASGVQPVSKTLFIDLLDPRYRLGGKDFPARIEGMAFGPGLDARRTLYLSSDNDYLEEEATAILVFAFDPGDLKGYKPQRRGK